LALGHLTLFA
jgi:hypothetical protein